MYFTVLLVLAVTSQATNAVSINNQPPQQILGNGINIGVLIPDNETSASRKIYSSRSDISPQMVVIEPCNLVTITGSKAAPFNGVYNKVSTSDPSIQIYRRVGIKPSYIVGLTDVWCLTMAFVQSDVSSATLSDIQSNCVNNECCLLVSYRYNGQLLTENDRIWTLNTPEDKEMPDQHIKVACSDFLAPKIGKKNEELIQINDSQSSQMQVETSVEPPISTVIPVIHEDRLQDFTKQILLDNCDMITCPQGSECLTKVGCNGCNPICNPYKNRQLVGVINIKCDMVKCPSGYTCQPNGDQVVCAA